MKILVIVNILLAIVWILVMIAIYHFITDGFLRKSLLAGILAFFGGFYKEMFNDFKKIRAEKKTNAKTA